MSAAVTTGAAAGIMAATTAARSTGCPTVATTTPTTRATSSAFACASGNKKNPPNEGLSVRQKDNEIRTTINGMDTTVRFFVQDGEVVNIDAFVGYSDRVIGNLIK